MKKTILVADAEPGIYGKLRMKLLAQRYEVLCAGNAQEALDRFDLRLIDLMLMDLDLPMPDGWSALPGLTWVNPGLLVIGLTERSDMSKIAIGARLSAVAEKPIDFRNLLRTIEEMLSRPPGVAGFRYVPPRTVSFRAKVFSGGADPGLSPAAYRGWGINE